MNDFLALYQIIIIDDEPWALNYMKKIFERRDLGFHICAAVSNAEAALKLIPSVHPHVIITDIQMPKITGLELLQKIKETAPECEVVIVSAYSNFDYAREALQHHAFDYCVKPVSMQDAQLLLQKLRTHLEKHHQTAVPVANDVDAFTKPDPVAESSFQELLVYIKNNFTQRLFLKELATQFALSPNYCCSLFTKTTGLTFSQYITKLRMEKALLLLQNPTLTINDIARLTGYDDQIYFSKVFKKYYSLTPSQYRDKMISGGIQ